MILVILLHHHVLLHLVHPHPFRLQKTVIIYSIIKLIKNNLQKSIDPITLLTYNIFFSLK